LYEINKKIIELKMSIKSQNSINEYLAQIKSLKLYINNLETNISDLKAKNAELTKRNVNLTEIININDQEKKSLKDKVENLTKELINTIKDKTDEMRLNESKLETEIVYYKGLRDTRLAKIDAADKIIKLNEIQHNYILKIEKELEELKSENDERMTQLKIEHENNYDKLKKKMIYFIMKSQKEMEKSNSTNIELYSKFSVIFKNQILNELENQNKQIHQLILEKEKQDKKIYALTEEIIIHDSVEKILKKKNFKYQNIINKYMKKKIEEKEKEKGKIIENIGNNSRNINFIENGMHYSMDKIKNMKKNFNHEYNEGFFKTTMNRKEYHDYISLEKEYKQTLKDYQSLKEQYKTFKDKEKLFQKKYFGIIQLYNTALDELVKDEELTKSQIFINLDNINKGDFESYTKEEKIKIIQMLIKHLLPLITFQNIEILKFRKTFSDLKIKTYSSQFNKYNSNSRNYSLFKEYNNNYKNLTEDSNIDLNKDKKFMAIFDKNVSNKNIDKINNIFDESNSFKSSFWGINFNKMNKEEISKYNKTNGFLYSAYHKPKKKVSEIKLNKRGIFDKELQYKKNPLLRYMYIQNSNAENQRNNTKFCLTDKNLSS